MAASQIANWFIQVDQQSPIVWTPRLQMFNHVTQIESRKKARLLQQLGKPRLDVVQTPQLLGNRSAQRVVDAARDLMRAEERIVAAGKPLDAGKRVPQRDVAKWRHSHHHLAPKTHDLRDASFQQLSPFGPSPPPRSPTPEEIPPPRALRRRSPTRTAPTLPSRNLLAGTRWRILPRYSTGRRESSARQIPASPARSQSRPGSTRH